MAEAYQPQIAPQRVSAALPNASPDSFGAGIGDAISGVGGNLADRAVREVRMETERRRDLEVGHAMAAFARMRGEIDIADNEARQTATAGAVGHADAMGRLFDTRATELLAGITDPDVRLRMEGQIANARAGFVTNADAFERAQTVRQTLDNVGVAGNEFANRAARADDQEALQVEIDGFAASVNMLSVDERTRAAVIREYRQQAVAGWVGNRPPEQVGALLDSGTFDRELTPQQQDALRSGANVEMRRRQMEADAAARAQAAAAKESIDQLQREASDGIPIDPARLEAARHDAQRFGFTGDAYDMAKLAVRDALNREFRTATPLQIERQVRALDVQIGQAGDRATPEMIIARDHMRTMLTARSAQVDNDPQAFGASLGIAFEPVDPSNAGSVQRRVAAARATAEATGRPPVYLSPQEVSQLQADIATPAGRQNALAVAQSFMAHEPQATRHIAEQIAPNDALFAHAAGLPGQIGSFVLEGRSIYGRSYTPPRGLDAEIQSVLGPALALMNDQSRNNVMAATRSLYAYFGARDNVPDTADSRVDRRRVIDDLRMATGARRRNGDWLGGIGDWNGQAVLLPSTLTQREFEGRMATLRVTGLVGRDGTPISGEALRANYTPVRQPDGRYRFRDGRGNYAVLPNQRVGAIDVASLGQ